MKTKFKTFRLFSMAALTLMMAACSNDDNESLDTNPAEAGVVHFKATLPAPNSGATTRTTYTEITSGDDAGKINVAWKAGDVIALCHNSTKDVITLAASDINADGSVTISADITATDGEDVTVFYPAAMVNSVSGSTPVTGGRNWQTQDGTFEYIATNLDLRRGTGKFAVSVGKASFQSDITMGTSDFAIWKLSLTDGSNGLNATQVTLNKGGNTIAAATSTAKSVYYMALPPEPLTAYSGDFTIEATVGSDTYIYSRSSLTLTAGKYYRSTVTMTKIPSLADATVGMIVGSDGKPYAVADKDNLPTGISAAGVVAYKSDTHGLVIALTESASAWNWTNANSDAASYTPAVSGQTWKLPSQDEWKNMLSGNDTDGWSSTSLNTAIVNAGGTALGADVQYWTSTQIGEYPNISYVYVDFTNNTGTFKSKLPGGEAHARACFAF